MTDAKDPETPDTENAPDQVPWQKIPLGIRRFLRSIPEREWHKVKAFLINSDEEGQIGEMLPLARRAMDLCPPRMIARIRSKEITGKEDALHSALSMCREAASNGGNQADVRPMRAPGTPRGIPGHPRLRADASHWNLCGIVAWYLS